MSLLSLRKQQAEKSGKSRQALQALVTTSVLPKLSVSPRPESRCARLPAN